MKEGGACKELTSNEPKAEYPEVVERVSPIKRDKTQEGIRITRGGGVVCQADQEQLMSVTIDVWCSPDVVFAPEQIQAPQKGPLEDDEVDPCNVYISMEHADGCVMFNLRPFLLVLGSFMICSGVCLQYLGLRYQQRLMIFLVRLGTFMAIMSFAYSKNYFAFVDPSEP